MNGNLTRTWGWGIDLYCVIISMPPDVWWPEPGQTHTFRRVDLREGDTRKAQASHTNTKTTPISPAGNWTPVSRGTGGDTLHYTTEDTRKGKFIFKRVSDVLKPISSLQHYICYIWRCRREWVKLAATQRHTGRQPLFQHDSNQSYVACGGCCTNSTKPELSA